MIHDGDANEWSICLWQSLQGGKYHEWTPSLSWSRSYRTAVWFGFACTGAWIVINPKLPESLALDWIPFAENYNHMGLSKENSLTRDNLQWRITGKANLQRMPTILGQVSRVGWESKLDSFFFKFAQDFKVHLLAVCHESPVIRWMVPVENQQVQWIPIKFAEIRTRWKFWIHSFMVFKNLQKASLVQAWIIVTTKIKNNPHIKRFRMCMSF